MPTPCGRWVEESWEGCRQKATDEGSATFVMEYGQGYTTQGHASCGHMNIINHGNFHESSVGSESVPTPRFLTAV